MLTVEQLYEAYMDEGEFAPEPGGVGRDFAEDIWEFFAPPGAELDAARFKQDYGMYLPVYDSTAANFAFQDKALSFKHAADTYNISKLATDRVYSEEMEKVSGSLETELAKGREISGGIGLRSGSLESALEDTITSSSNKARNLGDRLDIQEKENLDAYNLKMSDAALDHEKDVYETKEELYNRTMAAVAKLTEREAFREGAVPGIEPEPPEWAAIVEECPPDLIAKGWQNIEGKCFDPEGNAWASQPVWYETDTSGCECVGVVTGQTGFCTDVQTGAPCDPDWAGMTCDTSVLDCSNPVSCNYPCGAGGATLPGVGEDTGGGASILPGGTTLMTPCHTVEYDCSWDWYGLFGSGMKCKYKCVYKESGAPCNQC